MMGGWNSRMGQEQDEVGGETHQDQSSLFLQSERVDPSSQSNEISVHKFKMPDNPENDENQHKLLNEKVAADGIPFQEYSNYLEKVDDAKLSKVKGDSKNAIYEDEVKSSENESSEEDSGVYSNNDDSDENQLLHKSGNHEFLTKTNNVLDEDIKENIAKEKKTDDNSDYANENDSMQKKDNPKNLKNCQPLDIDESKITDDIEKRQRILCKICKNLIEEYSMHNHIRYHGVRSYGDYEYDNEYYNRCKICDHVMTFSYKHIQSHVYNVHGVTLGDYKNTYMRDAYTNMVNKGNQNHKHDNKTAMKRSRKCRKKGSCTEDTRFITDDIRDMRKVKCKLCGKIVLRYFMDGHIHHKHNVTHQEYGSFEYINNVSYYRCKLCPAVITFDFRLIGIHLRSKHDMKLSDYKLQHMGWKGNMTYDEMVSHLNRIQPRKTIQNQKDNIEDEIKAITKRSRKSENNDECPNDSEDENKTAMKRSRNSENNNECSNRSKDENKTAMKRSRKSENNDECSNDSKDENKTAMKRSRKSENNDECSNDSEDGNKTAMKKSRKSENNDECPNTSKGLEGSCNEDSRFISDDIREMRKIKCKLCGEIVLGYSFEGHLGWKHKVTRQEYGSLDYINNVSYYRCKLCQDVMIFDFKHINYHVGKVHSTKLSDYKLQYMGWKNKMTYEEMVSHLNIINPRKSKIQESAPKVEKVIKAVESNEHIKVFKKPIPQNSPITSRLNVSTKISKGVLNSAKIKQSHQEKITKGTACEDIRFVTDDIREMRKSKCSICGDLFLSSQIRRHIKDKHGVALNKYGPIKDTNNAFYRCKICSSVFAFCMGKISKHVRRVHRIRSVKVYKKKYMGWDEKTTYDQMVEQLDKVNPRNHQNSITSHQQIKIDISDKDESDHDKAMEPPEIPVISEKARVIKKKIKEVFKTSEPMKKHEVNEIKTDTFKRIFSDDVNNMCLIKCNICQMRFSSDKKWLHFKNFHKETLEPSCTFVRKTYYRCPDCAGEFLFCNRSLASHAAVRHNTTLANFKAKYLKIKPEKFNSTQKIKREEKYYPDNVSKEKYYSDNVSKEKYYSGNVSKEKYYSDNVSELCKYKCLSCGEENIEVKNIHTKNVHPEIKRKYKVMEKILHRCKICNTTTIFNSEGINKHLKKCHPSLNMTFKRYCKTYLSMEPQDDEMQMNLQVHEEKTNDKMPTKIKHKEKYYSDNVSKEKYYSDNVSELCQYKCLSCGEENIEVKSTHTNNVHPEIKKKYKVMEKILHRCKICNKSVIFNPVGINGHLKKSHPSLNITFKKYSKTYLNQDSKTKVTKKHPPGPVRCTYCPILGTKEQIVSHTKLQHKAVSSQVDVDEDEHMAIEEDHTDAPKEVSELTTEEDDNYVDEDESENPAKEGEGMKIFTNNVNLLCTSKCLRCKNIVLSSKRKCHIKYHHKDLKFSKKLFRSVRKTYHRCKLCNQELLFSMCSIGEHLRIKHNISTVTQYRWEHCVQQKVNQQVDKILTKTNERIKTKNSVDKSNIEKKRKHDEQDSGQSFKYQRNQNNTLRELAGNKDFLSDESDDEEDELVDNCYSTDVHKMCLSRCLYCLKIFSLNNIRPHIYRNHSKSTGNNDEQKFVYVRKTYYRCRICGKSLLFSFDSIFLHVKNNHYMNLAEYKDKYMGYNKDKYVYRRRPVYQSLSITPEIKLESSSPSIKTEPGLVPEPEEQKSLYFLQQNSSVLPKQEPDSEKTATGTDTLIHKQASTETSSALSENNTNLNIETLKTGHEESDSRLENLENLEEQANSLENLKNSEDTVDTSEAHIPEDLENGVKKEEDCKPEFVFKCPFNPCPAFTIEEGLKDGRAANHCIKVHKARPRHLLKLKLNWVRVPAGHTTWKDSVSSF